MKSVKSMLVLAAILSLTATAFATEFAAGALVHAPRFTISGALVHPEGNELSALNGYSHTLGPAQIHNDAWHHRVRTLSVSATSLAFGTVTLNSVSTRTITLQSTGTGSVTVSGLTAAGTGFAVAGPALPLTLSPGQSASVQVSFDPRVAGADTGAVSIASNAAGGSTITVSLSGTGSGTSANPVLTLSTASLNFGSVAVGSPVTQSVTLTSTGGSAVTVSAASLTGTGFTISGATFPVTLNPTIAIKVQVQFDPTAVGAVAGTLTFKSNSTSGSTSVVALSGAGTAVQHQVTLTWAAPTKSPMPVSGYNVYREPAGGSSYQLLNSSEVGKTSYVDQTVTSRASYNYYVKSVDSSGTESTDSNHVSVTIP
jgi:Abnormal spindle-like microcephaly-assoc'd, ASPM-SPD-2-Hydin